MSAKSPRLCALWSHPALPGARTTPVISTWLLGACLAACLCLEMATEGLLSSHNGLLMKFAKSLHSINHYWFRTRFISRSVFGCFVLKFIGSSLVSTCLFDRSPSWYDNPHQIICFLLAFCLVRSDSFEARELSGHMRYAAPATVALNFVAALYKMRSLSHLVDEQHVLGGPRTLVIGTLAFSACNALMLIEAVYLRCSPPRLPPASGCMGQSAGVGASCDVTAVRTPCLRATLRRHATQLALLLLARGTGSHLVSSVTKVLVLGWLFACYNEGALLHKPPASAPSVEATGARCAAAPAAAPVGFLMSALALPPAARRDGPSATSARWTSLLGLWAALIWLLGLASAVAVAPLPPKPARSPPAADAISLLTPRAGATERTGDGAGLPTRMAPLGRKPGRRRGRRAHSMTAVGP